MILEEGEGIHLLVDVRGTLRTLLGRDSRCPKHKNPGAATDRDSKERHPARELEYRFTGHVGKNRRSMSGGETTSYTIIQS